MVLVRRPYCPICKEVVEAVALPDRPFVTENYDMGIVIGTNGLSTGRWADGTKGTTRAEDEAAENEDTVYCLKHEDQECDWID